MTAAATRRVQRRRGLGSALLALTTAGAAAAFAQAPAAVTMDEAIRLALANGPAMKAARTQIEQSRAQEITAGLKPNPVFSADAQFIPVFTPSLFNGEYVDHGMQFDAGIGYLFERGGKRDRRVEAAHGQIAVTEAQVRDAERLLSFAVAQEFVAVLLAKANLAFAETTLESFRETVRLNEERRRAGDISQGDLLKIKLQMLQFQTDVSAARLAKAQALASLRQQVGFESVPRDFDVSGELTPERRAPSVEDLEAAALAGRPDLQAARLAVAAARSQVAAAEANAKQDPTVTVAYTHANASSGLSTYFTMPLATSNKNQGEIARTRAALVQAEYSAKAIEEAVKSDVRNAVEAERSAAEVAALFESGYLAQAGESRDIAEFAYRRGAVSLLDYLDAERSYRSTQIAYRQAIANLVLAERQVRLAIGAR